MSKLTRKTQHSPYPSISSSPSWTLYHWEDHLYHRRRTGIGFVCAEAFAQLVAKIITITSRTAKRIYAFTTDISKASGVEETFRNVANNIGPIDIFIANASYTPAVKKFKNMEMSEFRRATETNLVGIYLCAQYFRQQASGAKDPVFINMSTGHAHPPPQLVLSSYSISKAAAARTMDYLVYEDPGIRVYSIHRGALKTNMTVDYPSRERVQEDFALPRIFCV